MTNLTNGLTPGAIAELFAKSDGVAIPMTDTPVLDVRAIIGEDWAGLWIDDELVYQNHTVELHDVQIYVGTRPMSLRVTYASDALNCWLFDQGRFVHTDSFTQALDRAE